MGRFSNVQILLLVLLGLAIAGFAFYARRLLHRIGLEFPSGTSSWKSYLRGQGVLLFGFLVLGAMVATLANYLGPHEGTVSKNGRVIEYRQSNPSEHVVYEEQDVEHYRRVALLARTVAPQNGSATVVIYNDPKGGGPQEVSRMPVGADSWSEWSQPENSGKHMTWKIMNGSGIGATQVDVVVVVFPE